MRCPERFPCTCARAADVAAHEVPGDPVFGISSAARGDSTQTSSRGEGWVTDMVNHLYYELQLLLFSQPLSLHHTKEGVCVCVHARGCDECVVLGIKQMINPPLLSCQVIIVAPESLLIFSALLKDKEKLCSMQPPLSPGDLTTFQQSDQIRHTYTYRHCE